MNISVWKIAIRNLLKNKSFSVVSIVGLMLGFAGFIIVSLFIQYELSWDRSHKNYENIYRVQRHMTLLLHAKGGNEISPHTPLITASLIEHYPEIEYATAIQENEGTFLGHSKESLIYDDTGITADSNFMKVFTYSFIEGCPNNALNEPYSIVLSKSVSNKLFGTEKALNKTVFIDKKLELRVTGVYNDLPANSNINPAYIVSLSTLKEFGLERNKSWHGNFMTYILLNKNANVASFENKIKDTYSFNEIRKGDKLQLCPASKLHINFNGQTDYQTILIMVGVVGLFILLMSAFNYVNFAVSNASTRGKEVAIRKLSGVNRFGLMAQLQSETILLSFIAASTALLMVKLLLPLYNNVANTQITFTITNNWLAMLALIGISLIIGLLSGIYPSLIISSQKITKLVKGEMHSGLHNKFNIKNILVGLQFTISIFLICMTLFFLNQVNYMTSKDLGFNKDQILYAAINTSESEHNFEGIQNRLTKHKEILDISMSMTLPFVNSQGGEIDWEGCLPNEAILYRPNIISYNFIDNMGHEIVKGRNFSKQFPADMHNSCLINETAAKYFGYEDPIGKRINMKTWTIIGVVKDYHLKDMHNKIEPAVLRMSDGSLSGKCIFSIRYQIGKGKEAMKILKTEFETLFPDSPFEFNELTTAFYNEDAFKIYQSIKKSILFFTVFIILLAIIGLLGMVSYTTIRRTKEIGVRKINGSSVGNIFLLLNRDFFVLIFIALIIALPLSFLGYTAIPGNYKIAPQLWIPLLALVLITIIVLLTTIVQTLRAALRNPVEALRYE